jgi:hypothetical protein
VKKPDQDTTTVPGDSFSIRTQTKSASEHSQTQATTATDLDADESLLSDKPIRRPNRTRPVED